MFVVCTVVSSPEDIWQNLGGNYIVSVEIKLYFISLTTSSIHCWNWRQILIILTLTFQNVFLYNFFLFPFLTYDKYFNNWFFFLLESFHNHNQLLVLSFPTNCKTDYFFQLFTFIHIICSLNWCLPNCRL